MWKKTSEYVRQLVFGLALAILFTTFVVQGYKVEGASMQPTLQDEERIFVNKFIYFFEKIERGDIVVFWYPQDPEKSFIKRVIGLPGDWVWIEDGSVYINGVNLSEPYLPDSYQSADEFAPRRVPDAYYFVLGDHRLNSSDSRSWGFVPAKYIRGRAFFRFWPLWDAGAL